MPLLQTARRNSNRIPAIRADTIQVLPLRAGSMAHRRNQCIMTRPNYGPNYRTPDDEHKALRQQTRESWYDVSWAMLYVMLPIIGTIYLLIEVGRAHA